MYYLVYSSTAQEGLNEVELHEILSASARNNEPLDITGMLLFHKNTFIQMLEGPKENVLDLFNKIKKDGRHHGVLTLYEGETDHRFFPHWRMAFEAVMEKTFREMTEYENLNEASDFLEASQDEHQGLKVLRYFYNLKMNGR